MIIAVTGITGHSGRFFLDELESHSFNGILRCLVRETSNTEHLDSSKLHIQKIIGDVNCYDSLVALTQHADIVMHIFNIHNSLDVLNASLQNNVTRLVMVHTAGVYSKYKQASEEYRKIEAGIEQIIQSKNIDLTILRPTMIFGDMCDKNISKFIKMVDRNFVMPEIKGGARENPAGECKRSCQSILCSVYVQKTSRIIL